MAGILFLNGIDLNKNELQNARIHNAAAGPSSPVLGQVYFDTGAKRLKTYNGGSWDQYGTTSGTVTSITLTQPTAGMTITNSGVAQTTTGSFTFTFTGEIAGLAGLATNGLVTRTASGSYTGRTITGTANQVIVTNGDGVGGNPVLALPQDLGTASSPTLSYLNLTGTSPSAGQAVRKDYVDNLLQGIKWKQSVRVCTTAEGTMATSFANGSIVDGITLVTGDRILIRNQVTTPSSNGIYTVNASGAPTRATDANTWLELVSASVMVENGTTLGDTSWVFTIDQGGALETSTIGSTQLPGALSALSGPGLTLNGNLMSVNVDNSSLNLNGNYVQIKPQGILLSHIGNDFDLGAAKLIGLVPVARGGTGSNNAAGARTALAATGKYAVSFGDGTATAFTITHNLVSTDVSATFYVVATGQRVEVDYVVATVNTITFTLPSAPTANQYRCVVVG